MLIVHCAESRGKQRKLAGCAACAAPAVCTGAGGQPIDCGAEAPTASQVLTQAVPGACARGLAERDCKLLWMTGRGQAQDTFLASATSKGRCPNKVCATVIHAA